MFNQLFLVSTQFRKCRKERTQGVPRSQVANPTGTACSPIALRLLYFKSSTFEYNHVVVINQITIKYTACFEEFGHHLIGRIPSRNFSNEAGNPWLSEILFFLLTVTAKIISISWKQSHWIPSDGSCACVKYTLLTHAFQVYLSSPKRKLDSHGCFTLRPLPILQASMVFWKTGLEN